MKLLKTILLFAGVALAVSCEKDPAGAGAGKNDKPSKNKEITISPERNKVYRNPLNGFVLYAGLGNDMTHFWERYEAFQSANGIVNVCDYANTLLIRGNWAQLNPEEGLYIWMDECQTEESKRYKMLVKGAWERGMRVGFGYRMDSRDLHEWATPRYVKEKGAKGYETRTGSATVWTPYPDDPVFQQCYEKFVHDFAQHINDPQHYEFVHGVGIGKWGEYHECIYSTGDEKPKIPVFEWVTDLFVKEFTKIPTFINYHRHVGALKGSGTANPDSEGMIDSAVKKGMSIGSGAFGMGSYYNSWEKRIVAKYRYQRPVVAEGGWVKASHGSAPFDDPNGYETWYDVRKGEYDDAIDACANMLDLRYNDNPTDSEAYSWFNDAYTLLEQFLQTGTYRLYPQKISVPVEISNGDKISIVHKWVNLGNAYCPTNIPQFEGKYKVAFALIRATTGKIEKMFYDEAARPCDWIKGKTSSYELNTVVSDVAPGTYIWAVGIVDDHSKEKNIGIYISAKGDFTEDNWLRLTTVTVK